MRTSGEVAKVGGGKAMSWAMLLRQCLHPSALLIPYRGDEPGQEKGMDGTSPRSPPFAYKLVSPTGHELLHCQTPRELQNWGTTMVGRYLRGVQSNPARSRASRI